ncbi:hypothetical protein ACOSQ4_012775 [Xanthoceras sorbifolium]
METLGRLVYHCRASPTRLDPKPLHMHFSLRSHRIAAVNILYRYCAMWSSGSVVPSYCFILGKLNFLGISTTAIVSTNGKSEKLLAAFFFIGAGIPGICWMSASISVNIRAKSGLAKAGSEFTRFVFDGAECEGPEGVPCGGTACWVESMLPLGVEIGVASCTTLVMPSDWCTSVPFEGLHVGCYTTFGDLSAAWVLGSVPARTGSRSLAVIPYSSERTGG